MQDGFRIREEQRSMPPLRKSFGFSETSGDLREMKKAGVVVDNYKLPTFRKNLKDAGFTWKETKFTGVSTTMTVPYGPEDLDNLAAVVKKSNDEARKNKQDD